MRDDFAAFILTHKRPDRVFTYNQLCKQGYTGKVYFVVDDEDPTLPQYRERFGAERVLTFSKEAIAQTFDEGDNFVDRRAIIYARNASWDLARQIGVRYFMQLDDDYTDFRQRFNDRQEYGYYPTRNLDAVLSALLDYFVTIPALSICFSQGGDHIGGGASSWNRRVTMYRKAMNTFLCDVERPFQFFGRINEDVNTYVLTGMRGGLFFTLNALQFVQVNTQTNAGGMTELYLDGGTYRKSFYSVMYAPSCVKIADMGPVRRRIHHKIDWPKAVPKILRESHRRL